MGNSNSAPNNTLNSHQEIALSKFISNLILAYTKHLLTISGFFNGTIPATPSPIPGPPLPFIGIS
jgi:hypothetical protein